MIMKKINWFGIVFGGLIIVAGIIFFLNKRDMNLLFFLIGISLAIMALPFVVGIVFENKKEQEMAEMFLEFSRNLAESVNVGTPVSKSIINMRKKNFGSLTPHIEKLANQIELGIPVGKALQTFAYDVDNSVIRRAVALIREAEKAGGEIDYILDSVAKSIAEVEKLKKERKAGISNLVVQGYIIFFVFIGIMLVMQFKILPLTAGIGGLDISGGIGSIDQMTLSSEDTADAINALSRSFLYLLLAQGFFAGITIGKLSEGSIKAGIKHSFIMMIAAFLISSGAQFILS